VSLIPKFLTKKEPIIRLNGKYYESNFDHTHVIWRQSFVAAMYKKFLSNYSEIHEFGCGSGHNLLLFDQIGSGQQKLKGYDRSINAVKCLNEFGIERENRITGETFDMRTPIAVHSSPDHACYTHGSIEQLGEDYHSFVDFLLSSKFGIFVHVEPLYEFYDPNSIEDFYAIAHHIKRGYPTSFLTYLRSLHNSKTISVISEERIGFGARHIDGYSLVVWKKNDI
jgi:hypothetical protein